MTYQSSKVDYCVCNPTTEKFTIIPQPSVVPPEEVFGFSSAFDPSTSLYYKIVCIRIINTNRNIAADIYSSETGTWRTCDPDSDAHFDDVISIEGFIGTDRLIGLNKVMSGTFCMSSTSKMRF